MNRPIYDEGATPVAPRDEPRRRRPLATILGLLILLVVVAAVVAFLLARKSSDSAKKDVTIQACQADPGGGKPKASGQILNHSSKTSNYVVNLKFKDAQGNAVATGVAPVKSVKSKQSATWELTGTNSAKGPLTCAITGVSRTHLPGQ
jgi:hypothetical protein